MLNKHKSILLGGMNMNWRSHYDANKKTAEEAVKLIQPGDKVSISHATGEPTELVNAMVRNKDAYSKERVEVIHMIGMGESRYTMPDMEPYFHHTSLFSGAKQRKAINDGRADLIPVYFHEVPDIYLQDEIPIDVAMITVTPPDKHGYVSLGVAVDYGMALVKTAKTVIAQVNSYCPRTHGDSFVHVSEIDCFVEIDKPLIQLIPGEVSDVEESIGKHCASLIEDGDTLQLGIGSLPDAILKFLTNKNNLGIHSEMISEGVMELMLSGNINNKNKTLHPGKTVVTFLMGTQKIYDFVDDNPAIYMAPVNYVNNPYIIAQNDHMVSINSCIQVDLAGQVSSEGIGISQVSGVGGQVDFVRGANMSKGGKAIIALSSATKNGETSKIVPFLDQGARVTTTHHDVNYVVTEYGIAKLRHVSYKERARQLIAIAHPKFRPELTEEYYRRFKEYWYE